MAAAAATATPAKPPPQTMTTTNILESLPFTLPTTPLPPNEPAALAAALETCTALPDNLTSLTAAHFVPDALWRDNFALTGSLRTFYSARSVVAALRATGAVRKPRGFAVLASPGAARVVRLPGGYAWVDVPFVFECAAVPATRCSGVFSLVPGETNGGGGEGGGSDGRSGGGWKVWMVRTVLDGLVEAGDVDVLEAVGGVDGSAHNGHAGSGTQASEHFDCVVVGGGQAGLSTAGRMKALGLSYVVVDKQPQVGDSWNSRYDSMKLHTVREYAHLPYERTYPAPYPRFLTKANLAEGHQRWVEKYGINVWTSTELVSGSWNEMKRKWTLTVHCGENKEPRVLSASHVVMSVGEGGQLPVMPTYPGQDKFGGLILHSSQYKTASDWAGLRGLVVGTANTGHDVAEDMVAAKLKSVTMIQRSRTYVFPTENWGKFQDLMYNEHVPTAVADKATMTGPNVLNRLLFRAVLDPKASTQLDWHQSLEKAGFKTEPYGDLSNALFERMGGHYMDTGNCKNILDGLVKVKSDAVIERYTADGIEFSDGSHVPADIIVYCTGFTRDVKDIVARIFGKETAGKVEDFWGLDEEGELKGAFKPTGHPGLWYMGGGQGQARYLSRFVALQIKADLLGTPLPIYSETP